MFDLITGEARHLPRHPAVPILVSTAVQVVVVGVVVAIPLLYVTNSLPEMPTMMAFVAEPPPPPPPPPAPAPPKPASKETPSKPTQATLVPSPEAAPIEAPPTVEPETVAQLQSEEGVPGGVEGGVPGGVAGGVVGGLPSEPPPPPPAPPAAPRGPVRIGGKIQAPALVHRVEPVYPDIAVQAQIEGVVILEAEVNEDGRVEEVRVLRSVGVLDRAAMAAVSQWRYSPLLLNGQRERFVLTVTLSFYLDKTRR